MFNITFTSQYGDWHVIEFAKIISDSSKFYWLTCFSLWYSTTHFDRVLPTYTIASYYSVFWIHNDIRLFNRDSTTLHGNRNCLYIRGSAKLSSVFRLLNYKISVYFFGNHCLSFCPIHLTIISSRYGLWVPQWYLQVFSSDNCTIYHNTIQAKIERLNVLFTVGKWKNPESIINYLMWWLWQWKNHKFIHQLIEAIISKMEESKMDKQWRDVMIKRW